MVRGATEKNVTFSLRVSVKDWMVLVPLRGSTFFEIFATVSQLELTFSYFLTNAQSLKMIN